MAGRITLHRKTIRIQRSFRKQALSHAAAYVP